MATVTRTKEDRKHKNKLSLTNQVILAGTSYTTDAIDLENNYGINGNITLYFELSGDGTAKVEYLVSVDGTNFVTPSTASDILTGFTKTSGTAGKDIIAVSIISARYLKFKFTETGTSDNITVNTIVSVL
jgi:hypothetical protein